MNNIGPPPFQQAERMRLDSSGALGIGSITNRTIVTMTVETAVNGYIVVINSERFIAHKPDEITELLMKRLATAHLED